MQSFDPAVQRAINRVQSFEATAAATAGLRRAGIAGINFDLIYGLPHQTVASCLDTVSNMRRAASRPLFRVRLCARSRASRNTSARSTRPRCPTASNGIDSPTRSPTRWSTAGYLRIGLDHFALPGDEHGRGAARGTLRRNFQGYTTDTGNILLGFGARRHRPPAARLCAE